MAETTALDALTAEERSLRALLRDGMREGYTGNDISNLLEVIDALRTRLAQVEGERDAVNDERRLVNIELAQARRMTCVCPHPHGECLTCGCVLLGVKQYVSELTRTKAERDAAQARVRRAADMLAVIHRDGGHYLEAHGWDKACADAEARVWALVAALTHVRACATCSELDWAECGDGRDALALLEETR